MKTQKHKMKGLLGQPTLIRKENTGTWTMLWLALVGYALSLGASNWDELTRGISDRLLAADNLLLMGLVFPVAKLVHEFGHALDHRRFVHLIRNFADDDRFAFLADGLDRGGCAIIVGREISGLAAQDHGRRLGRLFP